MSRNYKATKKKIKPTENVNKAVRVEKNQHLIHEYYCTKPNNQVIAGPSNDDVDPRGPTQTESDPAGSI